MDTQSTLYTELDTYPWDTDPEFLTGLRAILGSTPADPAQIAHLTLRAKCYYFARKNGTPVDFDGYKSWVEGRGGDGNGSLLQAKDTLPGAEQVSVNDDLPVSEQGSGGMGGAPHPASFAEICALIEEGKPIPGIKDIPDTVLEGRKSERQAEKRRKPWEKSGTAAESDGLTAEQHPSWMQKLET